MTAVGATESQIVQLDASNAGGLVTVTPDNEDRFNIRVGEAIAACQRAQADEQAVERFKLMLTRLGQWMLARTDVRDAYLTSRDGNLCFVVIHSTPVYDATFEDALSALDLEIARDPDMRFPLDVLSLPPVSQAALQSFVGSSAMQFRVGRQRE